jgi:hypothetical protein
VGAAPKLTATGSGEQRWVVFQVERSITVNLRRIDPSRVESTSRVIRKYRTEEPDVGALLGKTLVLALVVSAFLATRSDVVIATQPNPPAGAPQPVVISAAGDITAAVEQYRELLGPNNGAEPGSRGAGRREINWDGVADDLSAPNFMPPDFFNGPAAPRARGAFFSTPGEGVQVSADSDNPFGAAVRFGNINPTYTDIFVAFSEQRLFSPIGSNIVEMTFLVPGTNTPALTRGFGAVYTDVDTDHTSFEYFDRNGNLLATAAVPIVDNGLSFVGVAFDTPIVARVRITYGTVALGPDDSPTTDVAVMDDFIYGEPVPFPDAAPPPPPPTAVPAPTAAPAPTTAPPSPAPTALPPVY